MNFKKINNAKCDWMVCPDSAIDYDIVFSTAACLQGWTVGITKFSMKGNFSIVNVLSRYSL
jgi:hypothetical protein